ncbi:nuclease-related domain-containing protein [Rhodocyclus tenuis]|uniref:nuclease-related domain-containing protein n=1 Tax=Rhodocyclus tenuis TaxID=1066 RepID=UPI001903145B|nr:nuclease-related domain-containing protein [Rhodocyclus tenuis]MBK1680466.1 nuclease [Rhodocyclus tenuis]
MIIKEADDKRAQVAALRALLARPDCSPETRKRIEQEIRNIQAGVKGEAEAAYEMKVHYGESRNWAIIHDLRVEFGDLIAQIDHLVINRWLDIWVCESKHFSEGVAINEHGEFAAFFGSKPYGVPSPIEQNEKHILILQRLFESGAIALPTRLGFTIMPELKSLVLVSKHARISRPKTKVQGLERVIKNDQFFKTVDKATGEKGLLSTRKIISSDTLEQVANAIACLHTPNSFDWPAKFGLSRVPPTQASSHAAVSELKTEPELAPDRAPTTTAERNVVALAGAAKSEAKPKQNSICHSCGETVSYAVAKFCWFNKPKFGGKVYCMVCQKELQ